MFSLGPSALSPKMGQLSGAIVCKVAIVIHFRRQPQQSKHLHGTLCRMFREGSKSFVLSAVRIHGTSLVLISAQQDFTTMWHTPSVASDERQGSVNSSQTASVQHAGPPAASGSSYLQDADVSLGGHRGISEPSSAQWGCSGRGLHLPPQQPGAEYCAVVLPTSTRPLLAPDGTVTNDDDSTPPSAAASSSGRPQHQHPEVIHYSPSKLKCGGMAQGTAAWFGLHLVGFCQNCDERLGQGACRSAPSRQPSNTAPAVMRLPDTAHAADAPSVQQAKRPTGSSLSGAFGAFAKGLAGKLRPGASPSAAAAPRISPAKVAPLDEAEQTAALEEGRRGSSGDIIPSHLKGRLGTTTGTAAVLADGAAAASPASLQLAPHQPAVQLRQCLATVAQFSQYLRGPDVDVRCLAVHLPRVMPDGARVVWCPRVPRPLWLGLTPRDLRAHTAAQHFLCATASRNGSANRSQDAVGALLSATLSASTEQAWDEEVTLWHQLCHLLAEYTARPEARSLPVFTSVHAQPWRLPAVLEWETAQAQLLAHKLNKPLRKRLPPPSAPVLEAPLSPPSHVLLSTARSVDAPQIVSLQAPSSSNGSDVETTRRFSVGSASSVLLAPPTLRPKGVMTAASLASRRTERASSVGSAHVGELGLGVPGPAAQPVHSGPPVAGMGPPGGAATGVLALPVASPASLRAFSWASDASDATSIRSGVSLDGRGGGPAGGGSRVQPSGHMTTAQRVRLKRLTVGFSGSSEARSTSHAGSMAFGSSMGSVDTDGWASEEDEARLVLGPRDTSLDSGQFPTDVTGGVGPRDGSLEWRGEQEQDEEMDAVFELSDTLGAADGPKVPFHSAHDDERGLNSVPSALSIIAEMEDSLVHRVASGSTYEANRLGRAQASEELGDTITRVSTLSGSATAGKASERPLQPGREATHESVHSDGSDAVGQHTNSIFEQLNAALTNLDKPVSTTHAMTAHIRPLNFAPPARAAVDNAPGHSPSQGGAAGVVVPLASSTGTDEGHTGKSSRSQSHELSAAPAAAEHGDVQDMEGPVPVPVPAYQYEWGCDPVPLDSMLLMNRLPEWNAAAKTLSMKFLGARVTGSSSRNFLLEAVQGGGGTHVAAAAAAATRQSARARPSALAEASLMAEVAGGSSALGTAPDQQHCSGLPDRVIRAPSTPCLQFGRMKGNTYSLDYRHPMSAMQAFGVFLSAFMWGVSPSTAGAAGKGPPLQVATSIALPMSN